MSARETILNRIGQNKPAVTDETTLQILPFGSGTDIVADFCRTLESIGGTVIRTMDREPVVAHLNKLLAANQRVVNTLPDIGYVHGIEISEKAEQLSDIENTFLGSSLGVAENGAVWLTEKELTNRILPFITQHLIVVLPVSGLVANMHEAYARIADTEAGYHVFIAGPSKTADIEQSLVIGAHGPRSLLVYLVG